MKSFTCKQLGGPCDAAISGSTPEEVMRNGASHLMDMVQKDPMHKSALDMMNTMRGTPAGDEWNKTFMTTWNNAPDHA